MTGFESKRAMAQDKLAQPEQEPMAWGVDWGKAGDIPCVSIIKRVPNGGIEVMAVEYAPYSYTALPQRQWVELTKKEILNIIDQQEAYTQTGLPMFYRDQCLNMARLIAISLKEKNT